MIKNIFAAVDGSGHAGKALELAAWLASRHGARLTVGHVIMRGPVPDVLRRMVEAEHLVSTEPREPPAVANVPASVAGVIHQVRNDDTERRIAAAVADKVLEDSARIAREQGAAEVATRLLHGDPAGAILEAARDSQADMIVLGARGLSELKGLLMGSVSHKVAQLAECSVVTVK